MTEGSRMLALGGLLKRIGNFDNSTLESRKVFQKTIYLLQGFGLYLGYEFNWYIHGPYSSTLANDGFRMTNFFKDIPPVQLASEEEEREFQRFIEFLGDRKTDADWLEQLACIHFLKCLYPKLTKNQVLQKVLNHETHFDMESIKAAWTYLKKWNLI